MVAITDKESNLKKNINKIRTSHKTLFILCGLPYSGKTFFAEKIKKEVDCAHVSIDDIFHSYSYDWNTNTLPDEKAWGEIFSEAAEQTKNALARGENVLYDSTNHTRISRDALREMARSVGSEAFVVYVDAPQDLIYSRRSESAIKKDRHIVDEKLVQMTVDAFEPPMESENVLYI